MRAVPDDERYWVDFGDGRPRMPMIPLCACGGDFHLHKFTEHEAKPCPNCLGTTLDPVPWSEVI